jgi:hypothetical protein
MVEEHFRSTGNQENSIYRNNLKFHVLMVLGWTLNGGQTLPAIRVPHLDMTRATPALLKTVTDWVISEFDAAGAEDKTAKDKAFTERLKANWSGTLMAS